MTRTLEPARLAPGCHVYRVGRGEWRGAAPGDRFVRLSGPDGLLGRLRDHLYGAVDDPAALAHASALVGALDRRAMLAGPADPAEPAEPAGPGAVVPRRAGTGLSGRSVLIDGTGPVADAVAVALSAGNDVTRDRSDDVDLVVSCAGWLPDARWRRMDVELAGVSWFRAHAEGSSYVLGPLDTSYVDVRSRRLAAAGLPDELVRYWAYLDSDDPARPEPLVPDPSAVARLIVDELNASDQLLVDVHTGRTERHPVLPLPRLRAPALPADAGAAPDRVRSLVDRRLGLVTSVERDVPPPGTLRSCAGWTAHVAATDRFAGWAADRETAGVTFAGDEAGRRAAVGEAVERYCGNAVPDVLEVSSYDDLSASGRRAVDPAGLALYSPEQYATPGFPFVPFTRDLAVAWVVGRDLADGKPTLVPASLAYLNYYRGAHAGEPPTNGQAYAGIAAGRTVADACRAALDEAVERDAVTLWWMSGAPASTVDVPAVGHLLDDPDAAGLDVTLLRIPSPFGIPVVGAALRDRARGVLTLGTAARGSTEAAAVKALAEAVASQRLSLELLDPDCVFWRAVADGRIDPAPYRPYREDRRYRDSFRRDWRDVTDLSLHLQIYLDPRMQETHAVRLMPSGQPLEAPPGDLVGRLAEQSLRAVAVDLTTDDVAAAGLRVVRVVVPGLYCTAPAAFPPLGGSRLPAGPLVLDPVPFA